jgi:hypothetical protein
MAETAAIKPTLVKPGEPEPDGKDGGGKDPWGRALDVASVFAAIALGVILFDLASGGKIKALFTRKRPGPEPEPCEEC